MDSLNLALHKPSTQSSLGEWAMASTPELAAAYANNGSSREGFCHTAREKGPWWQVDLQSQSIVRTIRLHARNSRLERLTKIRVAGSPDGIRWKTMFRKRADVLGDGNILLSFDPGYVARHIRLVVENRDYLNFYECEIFGNPWAETGDGQLPGGPLPDHEADPASIVQIGGFDLFASANRYGRGVIEALRKGRYESHERQLARDLLSRSDRVLEVGTAIGVVTMTAAAITGAENVLTYDANPQIVQDARRNFILNDMAGIACRTGVLANRCSDLMQRPTVPFGIAQEFWASRLFPDLGDNDIAELVDVPVVCLEDKIAEHRATALICDIEGGETDLLTDADLSGIQTIIMETHTRRAGVDAANAMMRKLIGEDGFNIDLGRSGQHVIGLQR